MKKLLLGVAASACLLLASYTHANTIDFDDFAADGELYQLNEIHPNSYSGLNWSANWFLGDTDFIASGAHSGTNYLLNGFGLDTNLYTLEISSDSPFSFLGAWFASPTDFSDRASWVSITAYDAAHQQIGSTGNVTIDENYRWIDANFANVASLRITRDAGWFVMDDVTLRSTTSVPEPSGLALLLLGLAGLGAARRRVGH